MKFPLLFSILIAAIFLGSCTKDKVAPMPSQNDLKDTVSFNQKIVPLIMTNCATSGCHDAITAESGYNLTTYTAISNSASDMLNSMRGQNGFTPMPFNLPKLEDQKINEFAAWIAQGKLNN